MAVATKRSRADLAAQAQALRGEGLLHREIMERLGISRSYVSELLTDADGSKVRARKDSYRGTCSDCGAPTDGSNGRALAPKRCDPCAQAWKQSDEGRAALTQWSAEDIIAAIRWWNDVYGEPPSSSDWNPWQCEHVLHDTARAECAREHIENRDVPWFYTAALRFGSWNAAIEAAGFTPRAACMTIENGTRMQSRRFVT